MLFALIVDWQLKVRMVRPFYTGIFCLKALQIFTAKFYEPRLAFFIELLPQPFETGGNG